MSSTPFRHSVRIEPALEALILLVVAPLILFPERFPNAAIIIALALLLVPFLLRKATSGRFTAPTPANIPIAFLLFISLPVTVMVSPEFWEFTWTELIRILWGIAVFFWIVNLVISNNPEHDTANEGSESEDSQPCISNRLLWLTLVFLCVGIAFTAAALFALNPRQRIPGLDLIAVQLPDLARNAFGAPQGFNANRIASVAILYVPLITALLFAPLHAYSISRHNLVRFLIVKGALLLLCLYFTSVVLLMQARGPLLALGLALALLFIFLGKRGWFVLLIVVVIAVASIVHLGPERIVDRLTFTGRTTPRDADLWERVATDRNVLGRLDLWKSAARAIADRPITGLGLGVFGHVVHDNYPLSYVRSGSTISHAHNLYLQTAVDLGLPGLVALLALFFIAIQGLVRMYRGSPVDSYHRYWAIGMLGSLTAYLIYNVGDAFPLGGRPGVTVWFLFGLIVAAGSSAGRMLTTQDGAEPAHTQTS